MSQGDQLVDSQGYDHHLETDDYILRVNGEVYRTDIALSDTFSLRVPENATLSIEHERHADDMSQKTVASFSLQGEEQLDSGYENVTILMENEDYAFVTMEKSEHVYSTTVNGVELFAGDSGEYDYGYVTARGSVMLNETAFGLLYTNFQDKAGIHYKFKLNSAEGGLEIPDIEWGEEEIDFGGAVPVNPNRIQGSVVDLTIEKDGSITGMTDGKAANVSISMVDSAGDKLEPVALNQYELSFDVDFEDTDVSTFVNFYLRNADGIECRGDLHITGNYAGQVEVYNCEAEQNEWVMYDSFDSFLEQYGDWLVRTDFNNGNIFKPDYANFIYRMGDSSYSGRHTFTIKAFNATVKPAEGVDPAVRTDWIVGATDVTVDAETGAVTAMTNGAAPIVYQGDVEAKSISEYEMNFDIAFDAAPHHINIYLLDEDGEKVRADLFLSGNNAGKVSIFDKSQGKNVTLEKDAFMAQFGHYTVRTNYIEWAGIRPLNGNFFWRGGDSNYTGTGDKFTINAFTAK
ncbi:hypothetical protein [Ferrimonas gelatinilytica]|uniref:BIG2 domain-containing protein n=1 Tax=Ferrimonas gelatinilytica TaxID=1255257 RepID=A0ABP9SHF6_9GAMM